MNNPEVFMNRVADLTPAILTALAFTTFGVVGIFFTDYYTELFAPRFGGASFYMGVTLALIQEATRFGLLISSMRDFSEGKATNAYLGLIGSVGLVYHDVKTSGAVAAMYATSASPAPVFSGLITFLVLLGLLLEIRLILTMNKRRPQVLRGQTKIEFPPEPELPVTVRKNGYVKHN